MDVRRFEPGDLAQLRAETTHDRKVEHDALAIMSRPSVLLVDDEPRNVRLLEGMLYAEPYELLVAHSGAEALETIARRPPDLILLDVMMPGLSGFEVCKRIKGDPAYRMIPVVMVTALSDVGDRIEAMQAGADDFLSKPIDAAELIVRVRSLLRIRQLYGEVERVTAQRLRVMAGIAHDIRSPLNALTLSIELLADKLPSEENLKPLWKNINTCVQHIRMLTNDLLNYYQTESGQFKLNLAPVHMTDLISGVFAVAAPIAQEKNVNLFIDPVPDTAVEADQNALTQVLLNLLTNAVKYTEPQGEVRLIVHDLAQDTYSLPLQHYPPILALPSSGAVIEISDTGRGINAEDFSRVFTEFDRLEASDREGLGLGLAVSQRLIRRHGGEIWFTSAPGRGSTFAFFLPLNHAAGIDTQAGM
jgi:two-component system sensor histidine kinase/response regulator